MKLATFAVLLVLAIVVASCSRYDRPCLVKVAYILAANWLAFSMPWIYAPASYAFLLGAPARQEDGWALFDLLSMVGVITVCWRVWWAPVIWSIYLIMLTMHVVAWANGLEYVEYAAVLDTGVAVQLAVVFMVGGPGCADRLLASWSRVRSLGLLACTGRKASS